MPPAVIGGGIAALGALGGAYLTSRSNEEASDTAANATMYGARQQREMFEEMLAIQRPYMEAGYEALGPLQAMAMDMSTSPLYRLQQEEGTRAIQRAYGARGMVNSPVAAEAETEFTRRLSAEEADKKYGRLMGLAAIGQGSAGQAAAGALATGNTMANLYSQLGRTQASMGMQSGYAWGSALGDLGSIGMGMVNNLYSQGLYNSMMNASSPTFNNYSPNAYQGSGLNSDWAIYG